MKGFSLVELLVTVAIVAVLAALAFPSYASVQYHLRITKCASNLRQIGAGLFAYAADHDGSLPPAMSDSPPAHLHNQEQSWGWVVWPYVYSIPPVYPRNCLQMAVPRYSPLDDNIFHCPATRVLPVKTPTAQQVFPGLFSYGLNSTPLGTVQSVTAFLPIRLAMVQRPSLAAMVVESSLAEGGTCWGFFLGSGMIPHDGGTNVLYFDGHVDRRAYADIPTSDTATFWTGR